MASITSQLIKRKRQSKKSDPHSRVIADAKKSPETKAREKKRFTVRIGISAETLKPLFAPERAARSEKINSLVDLASARVKAGRTANLKNHKVWAAIDMAYDAPFNQITPTLVGNLLRKNLKAADLEKEVASWGLLDSDLFVTQELENGTKVKTINEKTFWKVLVPLVKSYTTIRVAKLFTDRNQSPFLKFEPSKLTQVNQTIGEIITELVQKMTQQYGLPAVLREALYNSLLYSVALVFPQEVWHSVTDVDEDGNEFTRKEGLRYNIPHPTRAFHDLNYRLSTFNTDTGCEYAGYWRLHRYGDLHSNQDYWNKDKISYGTNWFSTGLAGAYFTELYPCVSMPAAQCDTFWSALGDKDRTSSFYRPQHDDDKPVFVTDIFMKLTPADWDMGTYKHPVWFRFMMASDDTVIYCEPFPYCPVLYMGYDAVENRPRNASFALEVLPWQDHLGNIISQILLSAKQNLAKIIPYDTDMIDEPTLDNLRTQQRDASGFLFLPFSGTKFRATGLDITRLFVPLQFPQQSTSEMTQNISMVINIMERLLGMSSSELGAAGAHIQTAEEIRVITQNTSTRLDFTGTFVDEFIDAWKRQIYAASMEFMDEDFVVQVSAVDTQTVDLLKKIGMKLGEAYKGKVELTGKKSHLAVETFISSRDAAQRTNNTQIAQVMLQTIQIVAANPNLAQAVGADWIIASVDRAAQLSGAPKDWHVKSDGGAQQAQLLQQIQQQVQQLAQQIQQTSVQEATQTIQQKVAAPLAEELQAQGKGLEQLQQQTGQAFQVVQENIQKLQQLLAVALQGQQAPAPQQFDTRPPQMQPAQQMA